MAVNQIKELDHNLVGCGDIGTAGVKDSRRVPGEELIYGQTDFIDSGDVHVLIGKDGIKRLIFLIVGQWSTQIVKFQVVVSNDRVDETKNCGRGKSGSNDPFG